MSRLLEQDLLKLLKGFDDKKVFKEQHGLPMVILVCRIKRH